jgi:hypothetical protein
MLQLKNAICSKGNTGGFFTDPVLTLVSYSQHISLSESNPGSVKLTPVQDSVSSFWN